MINQLIEETRDSSETMLKDENPYKMFAFVLIWYYIVSRR